MQLVLTLLFFYSVSPSFSQSIYLSDYNYAVEDVKETQYTKEDLFLRMSRLRVKAKDSICSNRAHVWAYDFHKKGIKGSKIFLFFTPKTGRFEDISWWYHVAPLVNENGHLWVLDAGFPDRIKAPLKVESWLKELNGPLSTCKEMTSQDKDLMKLIFRERTFPEITSHGRFNCYYHITPPTFWIPSHVAMANLGIDREGRPIKVEREEFQRGEVLKACREATTTPFSWIVGKNTNFCRKFVEDDQNLISVY